jgi:hypothetical protein
MAKGGGMKFQLTLALTVAAAAVACVAAQAGEGTSSAIRVSGTYTVDMKAQAKVKGSCTPITKANPAVIRCWSRGFTLIWAGSLQGRSVIDYRGVIDCATGTAYTDGTERFTGSVEGLGHGTSTWLVQFHGSFDCKKGAVTSTSAWEDLISGTGALGALYGTIHRGPASYTGVLHAP